MSTIVLQVSEKVLRELAQTYATYQMPNKDPNKLHFFRVKETAISTYTSGKVLFQGPYAQELARKWGETSSAHSASSVAEPNDLITVGSDEVGNGSYFGGLAVVASLVRPDQQTRLKEIGVDDSKALTDDRIRRIAPILQAEIDHQALLLSPQKYNQVVPSRYNAVSVKVALHNQAIFLLLQKTEAPQQIIIDAFTSERNYQNYLKNESNRFSNPVQLIEKAESRYLAVAVSSIIARSLFLEQLETLSQEIGQKLPSGAGPQSDKVAAKLLKNMGPDVLTRTAKLHFKNTQKAKKLRKTLL